MKINSIDMATKVDPSKMHDDFNCTDIHESDYNSQFKKEVFLKYREFRLFRKSYIFRLCLNFIFHAILFFLINSDSFTNDEEKRFSLTIILVVTHTSYTIWMTFRLFKMHSELKRMMHSYFFGQGNNHTKK